MENQSYNPECVAENGILKHEEFLRYKNRSINVKFKQQLLLGVGGALVFGLAATLGSALVGMLHASSTVAVFMGLSAPALAGIGLAALAVVGLGCIYFGSKYLAENILMDQDFQAKKIGIAARGAPPTLEQEKGGTTTPPGMKAEELDKADEVVKDPKQWAAQFAKNNPSQTWSAKLAQSATETQAQRA